MSDILAGALPEATSPSSATICCSVIVPFSIGTLWFNLLGVLMLYLADLGDFIDGILARCKKIFSEIPSLILD